jgi:prepilin-type N-terminal cleavage/methylation domain-containing protein
MRSYAKRRCDGFTLVELLVVIVVIMLLAALVVPSMQQAMALAAQRKCQSHLHGLVQAHSLYGGENGGSKPPLVWSKTSKLGGKVSSQFDWASPNVKKEDHPIGQGILVDKGYVPFKSLLCPDASMSADGSTDEKAWRTSKNAGSSYSYFWRHSSTVPGTAASQLASGRKYFDCRGTGRSALIMDVNAADGHRYIGAYEGTAWKSHPRLGFVNIAYIDGSLRQVKNDKIILKFPFNRTAELNLWELAHKEYQAR